MWFNRILLAALVTKKEISNILKNIKVKIYYLQSNARRICGFLNFPWRAKICIHMRAEIQILSRDSLHCEEKNCLGDKNPKHFMLFMSHYACQIFSTNSRIFQLCYIYCEVSLKFVENNKTGIYISFLRFVWSFQFLWIFILLTTHRQNNSWSDEALFNFHLDKTF